MVCFILLLSLILVTIFSDCPDGWTHFKHTNKCYIFIDEKLEWEAARESCVEKSGDLASAPDEQTNKFLTSITSKKALIGGKKDENGNWSWLDGSPWLFQSWAPKQPSDSNDGEDYLEILNPVKGLWNDVPGDHPEDNVGFICQLDPNPQSSTSEAMIKTTSEPAPESSSSDKTEEPKENAEVKASSPESTSTVSEEPKENAEMKASPSESTSTVTEEPKEEKESGDYKLETSTSKSSTENIEELKEIKSNEPNISTSSKIDESSTGSSTTAQEESDPECEVSWTMFEEKCYHFFDEKLTWKEAREACKGRSPNKQGDLASAPDEKTNTFITSLTPKKALIGGRRGENEGWSWNDGSPWSFESWGPNQPSDSNDGEDYLEIIDPVKGKWNDVPADHPEDAVGYICQYDPRADNTENVQHDSFNEEEADNINSLLNEADYESEKVDRESKDVKKEISSIEKESKAVEKETKSIEEEDENVAAESEAVEKEIGSFEKEEFDIEKFNIENVKEESESLEKEMSSLEKNDEDLSRESEEIDEESENVEKEAEKVEEESEEMEKDSVDVDDEIEKVKKESEKVEEEADKLMQESERVQEESKSLVSEDRKIQTRYDSNEAIEEPEETDQDIIEEVREEYENQEESTEETSNDIKQEQRKGGTKTGKNEGDSSLIQNIFIDSFPGCKAGWSYLSHSRKCYKYVDFKLTWTAARASCQNLSDAGELASAPDQATNAFLTELIVSNSALIGGHKVGCLTKY